MWSGSYNIGQWNMFSDVWKHLNYLKSSEAFLKMWLMGVYLKTSEAWSLGERVQEFANKDTEEFNHPGI